MCIDLNKYVSISTGDNPVFLKIHEYAHTFVVEIKKSALLSMLKTKTKIIKKRKQIHYLALFVKGTFS